MLHPERMDVSYFAQTNHHQKFVRFGIKQADRLSHMYLVGATGVGKSTLLKSVAIGDFAAGRGFALLDPHGDLAEELREAAVKSGRPHIYLDAADPAQPYSYNPLRRVRDDKIPLAVNGLMDAMKKLWDEAWGVRMEHVLRNSLYALIERDGSTLPDLLRLYADKAFRHGVVAGIRNETVRTFWKNEFAKYPDRYRAEMLAPIQNKVGALLTDPHVYRCFVSGPEPIRFRRLMDQGGISIINLAKGRLGADSANVLGSILVATIAMAALSRTDEPPAERKPFFLHIDEFQSFTTLAFADLMPELRKMGCGIAAANQYLHQLPDEVRRSVLANAGTLVSFRVGAEDAAFMALEMQPVFDALDLINLPNHHFYIRLMIDGAPSVPFSATTLK
ncbi:MAG TPA: type IV secretory system conjugative DNA transfer family protein [Propylenella sp.]|nr:type IV secretory system conjugative DNA transfer family protein [Propylenella sp.]